MILNSLVWGTSWWPFRQLEQAGLHPLWSTTLVYLISVAVIALARPGALGLVRRTPALWVLMLAAGTTNAAFNWAVVIGDVVRVVLLFYLMPLWAALFAWWLLGERFTARTLLRVALAMAGAAIVLWPEAGRTGNAALPVPHSLADWLGVAGGMAFALNNVMLRRDAHLPEEGRAMAMFLGGAVVAGLLAATLGLPTPAFHALAGPAGLIAALLALLFLASNLALQYGASRLPANITSVVMLVEVVFASGSAIALGAGTLTPALIGGGTMILAAALLSAFGPDAAH